MTVGKRRPNLILDGINRDRSEFLASGEGCTLAGHRIQIGMRWHSLAQALSVTKGKRDRLERFGGR